MKRFAVVFCFLIDLVAFSQKLQPKTHSTPPALQAVW